MATYSQQSDYDASPWQPDASKGKRRPYLCPSPRLHDIETHTTNGTSSVTEEIVKYQTVTTTVSIVNGSSSSISEESFKSKLNITSDLQPSQNLEEAETKLNMTLSSFMDKIRFLEKQQEILEDRWSMLQVQETKPETDLEPVYLSYLSRLLAQVNKVSQDNHQTQRNLLDMLDSLNEKKDKFEDELCLRTDVEYAFVQLKKDVDGCSMERIELKAKHEELEGMIELMRQVYEQELKEVFDEAGDISVLLNIDRRCNMNLDNLVKEVKERYEMIAAKSREEAQALSRNKLEQSALRAGRCETELESSRGQITQLNSKIQHLRSEILGIQNQCVYLEQELSHAKKSSSAALTDANAKLTEVQEGLQRAKQEMVQHLHDYRELMNTKLALDVEIFTYNKLLEGEECRLKGPPPVVNIQYANDVCGPDSRIRRRTGSSKSARSSTSDY
ncbi:keratin, type II cytoskeletal 80-like [Discoglossus pictus]